MPRFLRDFLRKFFVFPPAAARTEARERLLFLGAGMLGGFLCGFFGTGGGMVIVLCALFFSHRQQIQVYAATAAAIALFSLAALAVHLSHEQPRPDYVVRYFLPGLFGGSIGALLLPHLPKAALRILFSVLLLVGGILMLFRGILHA